MFGGAPAAQAAYPDKPVRLVKIHHDPRLLCDSCYCDAAEWEEASGCGKIHSWTVCHHAFHPGFAGDLPYTLVTVDMEEGVRALGRWTGRAFKIGTPVQGRFVLSPGRSELVFDPAR